MLSKEDTAPLNIKVLDEDGKTTSLKEQLGKYIVLYFYPRDFTPGCTKEACSFRDANDDIKKLGAEVIGVSTDSFKSHQKFSNKHKLNITLWSDPDHKLIEAFGAWQPKKFAGREFMGTVRSTFIIDPTGKIIKVWEKVKPESHAEETLGFLKTLQSISP